jgi:hypothetical protein
MPPKFFFQFLFLSVFPWFTDTLHSEEVEEYTKILFDGKSFKNWSVTDYAGHGEVKLDQNGSIYLEFGIALTGVHWSGHPLPRVNYEIQWDARKEMGSDFFGSLTFPFKENHATLILGGWGGALVGISSIDGFDASENESSTAHFFKSKQWYQCRLRVTDTHFKFWVDGEKLIDCFIEDREISMRSGEIELSTPLGFSTYDTTGLIRNVVLRNIPEK